MSDVNGKMFVPLQPLKEKDFLYMRNVWMLSFALLPIAGVCYTLWHVWHLLPVPNCWRWTAVVIGVACFLCLFLSLFRVVDKMPIDVASVVYEVGNSSLFVLFYLMMVFLVLDLGRLVHLVPKAWLLDNAVTAGCIFLFMVAVFGYGNIHYYNKVRQPLSLAGKGVRKKVVMLSDLHLGYHNRRTELHRWVELINREQPALVLIAGDIIDMSVRPLAEEGMAEEFRRIKAPVVACLGNHEYISGALSARHFYREAGILLLRDSVVDVAGVRVIGRDDRSNPHRLSLQRIMQQCDSSSLPTILLDHQPYHLEEAEAAGVDFQFSGHTHHGQVWPVSWITDALYEDAFGPLQKGGTQYYVSSGMGIWGGKFRIGTRSEYVVLTIE